MITGRIRSLMASLLSATALAALVWTVASPPASADTLRLKNGKLFEGILVEENDREVVFDVIMDASRMRMSFRADEVDVIEKASVEERERMKAEMLDQRGERERYEEEMSGRGLVLHRGKWVTMEELRQREKASEPAQAARGARGSPRPVAPGFEIEDLEGRVHSMYQYRGRPMFLFFFLAKSRPCAFQIPTLKRANEKFSEEGLVVLGISLDADRERVRNFAVSRKIDFPILCDGEGWKSPVVKKYGVKKLPATYLVDRSGEVRAVGILGEYVNKEIEKLLNR